MPTVNWSELVTALNDPAATLVLRVSLVLVLALAITALWRSASASARHAIVAAGFAAALVVPALTLTLPALPVAILPVDATPAGAAPATQSADARESATTRLGSLQATQPPAGDRNLAEKVTPVNRSGDERSAGSDMAAASPVPPSASRSVSSAVERGDSAPAMPDTWLAIWLAGSLLLLGYHVMGRVRLHALARRSRIATSGPWHRTARALQREGYPLNYLLLERDGDVMPVTWGLGRARILVPGDGRTWPEARRRAVLSHELAHVDRRDTLWQAVASLVCIIHWFNPVVWMACRRLIAERELACDEQVVRSGTRPSVYARELLEVARRLRPLAAPAAMAFARRSQLEGRLLRILSRETPRAASRGFTAAAVASAVIAAAPLSATRLVDRPVDSNAGLLVAEAVFAALATTPDEATDPGSPTESTASKPQQSGTDGLVAARQDTTSYNMAWTEDGHRVSVRGRGRVTLTDDDSGIAQIQRGGYLRIQEQIGSLRYRLEMEPTADNGIDYAWWVDGRAREFNRQGREWLADIIETLIYRLGFAAEQRVARILEQEGAQGVYREIGRITSDYAKRKYFVALLDSGRLTSAEMQRGLRLIGDEIDSDYEKAELLLRIAEGYLDDPELREGFLAASQGIDSDYEQRRVLDQLVRQPDLSPEIIGGLLASAGSIGSDYERVELLTALAGAHEITGDLQRGYLELLQTVDSDYEVRRALQGLTLEREIAPEHLDLVLTASETIDSDYELAELLLETMRSHDLTASQQQAVVERIGTIDSDYEQRRVLSALLGQQSLAPGVGSELLRLSTRLGSDYERAEFLLESAGRFMMDAPLRDIYLQAARDIDAGYERRRVLQALVDGGNLNDEQLQMVLEAARGMSDYELAELLVSVARLYTLEGAVRETFADVADEIGSEYEHGRVASAMMRGRI